MSESQPLTCSITAVHANGFEVAMRLQVPSLDALEPMIAELTARGYRPARTGDTWQRTPEGLPICPKHGAVLRERLKQGDSWHSHAVITQSGEELYCRGYPGPSSPGWEVAP
jgi:hypothetical protein